MDAVVPQDVRRITYGQAVWSCPLDAGVKSVEMINRRRWLLSPRHRGEHGAAVQTIAQGVPDRFGKPVVTMLVWFLSFPREAAGAASARHSLRPLFSGGTSCCKDPDASAPRECESVAAFFVAAILRDAAYRPLLRMRSIHAARSSTLMVRSREAASRTMRPEWLF